MSDGQYGDTKQHHHHHSQQQKTINQSSYQHDYHQVNRLEMPIHHLNNVYIESYKIFLPDGAYSYASELTVQVDQNALGEYLCVNFGASSIHYKSAFIKLKGKKDFWGFSQFVCDSF